MHLAAWAPLTAFTAALVTVWWLMRSRFSALALDHPNPRSLHNAPVPRTGGIGLHLGVTLAWAMVSPALPSQIWLAFAVLLLVSFIEDIRGVPIVVRLVVHLLLAGTLATGILGNDWGMIPVLVATLAITWMANLYNFMDGSDGLAGGMAVLGFTFYAVAAWLAGDTAFALLNLSVATAAAAFLVFNFHPARIFMGDVGSVPLGFLGGIFGLVGWQHDLWPWWFPFLVFAPFIVDATVTLARRLLCGERFWEAHRDHYYQRLVQMGWGHRSTALAEYALMAVSGLTALAVLRAPVAGQITALVAAAVLYMALIARLEYAWRKAANRTAR